MSRQGFQDFVHAVEHSAALRRDLKQHSTIERVVKLAQANGFSVQASDFDNDAQCEQMAAWFASSWIH